MKTRSRTKGLGETRITNKILLMGGGIRNQKAEWKDLIGEKGDVGGEKGDVRGGGVSDIYKVKGRSDHGKP